MTRTRTTPRMNRDVRAPTKRLPPKAQIYFEMGRCFGQHLLAFPPLFGGTSGQTYS